ncbi:MAG: recJ [Paenibacillaceae bacterium]|jgi:single-stranded-DNA-specific exonuclease|nr:recJ [Paenibacillaceae bacterium]
MLEAKARWMLPETHDSASAQLAEELQLHPLIARLMSARGIGQIEQARHFLYGGIEQFHDPFLMKGMREAAARITLAVSRGEKIRIYGDYDADGISSTTLMDGLMKALGADYDTYIPHRIHEGYGMNRDALDLAKSCGVSLIVTVDTGISAREEIAYARELGMDVVVTDHHEPPELLPDAAAVVNPKQPDCPYPCKELAGVGVAFKLAHAVLGEIPLQWLELAAIGTVADLMPLIDENRLIVKLGLTQMRSTSNLGIRALLDIAGVDRQAVNETHIGFSLAPRINASGRMNHASLAVRLLTTANVQEAELLALELDTLNKERQKIVEEIMREALARMSGQNPADKRIIVVSGSGWSVGVVGIVASKLLEKYYRPVLVLAVDPETGLAKGSARSIPGFDMYRALTECADLLDHYGGHQAAAGLTLSSDRLPELEKRLEQFAQAWLTEEHLTPVIRADMACSLADTPLTCIEQLAQLAPFGNGNPAPRFVFEGLRISEKRTMGREQQHLKLLLAEAQAETAASMEAIGFNYGSSSQMIAPTSSIDVLGELSVNEWNGARKPQIVIQDMRISGVQVFDWRGTRAGGSGRGPALPEGCGLLLFEPDGQAGIREEWRRGAPVWTVDGTGLPVPQNAAAEQADYAKLKDLVLYSLPPYQEWLEEALARLGDIRRIYAVFADANTEWGGLLPDRESFKNLYGLLAKQGRLQTGDERIWPALKKRLDLSKQAALLILGVFEELGFAVRDGVGYAFVRSPAKRELTESTLYLRQSNRERMEQLYIYSTASELTEILLAALARSTDAPNDRLATGAAREH